MPGERIASSGPANGWLSALSAPLRTTVVSFGLLIGASAGEVIAAEAISPEATRHLQATHAPVALVDADRGGLQLAPDSQINLVFYSRTPTAHSARSAAEAAVAAGVTNARWLAGTPFDWEREKLGISAAADEGPLPVRVKELAAALKDGAEFQLIDVRPPGQFQEGHLAGAKHSMPHEIDAAMAKISKARWTILIGDDTDLAQSLARDLYRKGYVLSGWLDGGYPAWMAEPNK
jgi:rhodanese-related sulfurtransferase